MQKASVIMQKLTIFFLNFLLKILPAILSLYCRIGPDPNFLPNPYKIIPDQE
jgi:hypothetical protein